MPADPVPTIPDIEAIRQIPDRVVRNLRITQCYHELSDAMTDRIGRVANWCTFATWASKQAGRTIRGEDFENSVEGMLTDIVSAAPAAALMAALRAIGEDPGIHRLRDTLRHALGIDAALERASLAVAAGNLKVFEEIGLQFAAYLRTVDAADHASVDAFYAGLRPGDPPEAQAWLRRAFAHYRSASATADAKARAELILMASAEIGFHEQTRLQPEIEKGVDAALEDPAVVRERLLDRLLPKRGWFRRLRWFITRALGPGSAIDNAVTGIHGLARARLRALITEHVMTIDLPPDARIRLGHDVPRGFPEDLRSIDNPELIALLDRFDPTPDTVRDSGALDWTDFDERIHFIFDLFRCYQEAAEIHSPPFDPEQTEAIRRNHRPVGRL